VFKTRFFVFVSFYVSLGLELTGVRKMKIKWAET